MNNDMNVANKTVRDIFGKSGNAELIYEIPPYQRGYAWEQKQVEELFYDICENSNGYFIGSIICIRNEDDKDFEKLEVVDGQQRLTTISLLLLAILDILKDKKYEEFISVKYENYMKDYLSLKDMICIKDRPRLKPSIQKDNLKDYIYLLCKNGFKCSECEKVEPSDFKRRGVSKTFDILKNLVESYIEEKSENKETKASAIFELLNKVTSLMMVVIEVKDASSAFTLFESVNNRGLELSPMDLIKNAIMAKLSKSANTGKINEDWQIIVDNIENYEDQVRFLRHYYHAFQCINKDIKLDGYSKITKKQIVEVYTKLIVKNSASNLLNDLIEKSKIYKLFVNPESIDNNSQYFKYKDDLIELKNIGVAPSYALLLFLFGEYKNEDFTNILKFLQNWFIRRHLTNIPSTNKLDQIFLDLVNLLAGCCENCDKEGSLCETIISYLKNPKYYVDDEFEKYLIEKDIYDINPNATRVLLIKLEKSKRTKENETNFWEKRVDKKGKMVWEVEHIFPQRAKEEDWDNKNELIPYLHKLGNLTLTRYNQNLGRKSFKDKCKDKNIGLKSGNVKINSYIKDTRIKKWTVEHIKNRGQELADEILKVLSVGC